MVRRKQPVQTDEGPGLPKEGPTFDEAARWNSAHRLRQSGGITTGVRNVGTNGRMSGTASATTTAPSAGRGTSAPTHLSKLRNYQPHHFQRIPWD